MSRHLAALALGFAALNAMLALPVLATRAVPGRVLVASLVLITLLALLAAFDCDQFRLPDTLTLPLGLAGLAATAWIGASSILQHALAAGIAGGGLWLVGAVYHRLRGRSGLGLGDVKLFAALATWIGPEGLATALLLACLAALTAILVAHAQGRRLDATTPVPFGIFLALGGWTTWVYGPLV
ncbi:MAG: prepilin peptidase [Hyphomicrobiaceae bacterium]